MIGTLSPRSVLRGGGEGDGELNMIIPRSPNYRKLILQTQVRNNYTHPTLLSLVLANTWNLKWGQMWIHRKHCLHRHALLNTGNAQGKRRRSVTIPTLFPGLRHLWLRNSWLTSKQSFEDRPKTNMMRCRRNMSRKGRRNDHSKEAVAGHCKNKKQTTKNKSTTQIQQKSRLGENAREVWWESQRLGASGSVWGRLGASGSVWERLGASGGVWERLGSAWERLGAPRSAWERLGGVGERLGAPCLSKKRRSIEPERRFGGKAGFRRRPRAPGRSKK